MSEYGANLAGSIALLGPISQVSSLSLLRRGESASIINTACRYPAASSVSATAGNVEVVPATTSVSDVSHGKRRHDAEESYGNGVPVADVMPPHKRVRGGPCNGLGNLEATCSGASTRTHRMPDMVPTSNKDTPKDARRGAEGLTNPNVQGVYHHSLLGQSFEQGWVATTAQG